MNNTMNELKIIPVSLDIEWRNAEANAKKIHDHVEGFFKKNATIDPTSCVFVFPELTLHGFVLLNPDSLAIEWTDPVLLDLQKCARTYRCNLVVGGIEENIADPKKPYNALWTIDSEGKILSHYRKQNLFTQGNPSEADLYQAGSSVTVAEIQGWKLGFGICFDLRFPEVFQHYRRMGVDATILPACWVDGPTKEDQFQVLSAGQAVLSQAYFISVNRAGEDPHFKYTGSHYAFAPTGQPVSLEPQGYYSLTRGPLEIARKIRLA